MKKLFTCLVTSTTLVLTVSFGQTASHVVISEVYGGGGNSGATWKNDFIELYNPTSSSVSLTGWSVQYASAASTGWAVTSLTGTIAPQGFFLVQEAQGAGGTQNIPTPDVSGTIVMSATAGKIALVNSTTPLTGTNPTDPSIVDKVGFGTTANGYEGSGRAPAPSNTKSIERKAKTTSDTTSMGSGGTDEFEGNGNDSDNNANDFVTRSSPQPQNSASVAEPTLTASDTTPPVLVSAKAFSANEVEVVFNESIDSATSSSSVNYAMNNGIMVNGAARNGADGKKVTLTVSSLLPNLYSVTVQNVKDTAGNAMSAPQTLSFQFGVLTIAQARAIGAGNSVRLQGVVTVAREFNSPSFLQDSTGGIAVFNTAFSNSARVADLWEVAGTLSSFNGMLEISPLTDSIRVSTGNPLPKPKVVTSRQVNESYEAQLVRFNRVKFDLSGSFAAAVDSNYVARDADSSFTVRIDKDSNIPASTIPPDSINIVGVLGEFNGAYQLLPRSISDVGVVDPPPEQTWLDISAARGMGMGTSVKVRGIVTYNQPSATIAKTIFLQDGTAGIAIFDPKSDTLLIGDSVEVKGVVDQFNNLLEIKAVDSLTLFGRGLVLPSPKLISISTASETFESQLVKIGEVQFVESGVFSDGTSGMTYHITNGSAQLDVRLSKNSSLTGSAIPQGTLDIVGILGQFGSSYQIIPRSTADLLPLPGPQIASIPQVTGLTDTSFAVNWMTVTTGDSRIYYGPSSALEDSIVVQEAVTNHVMTVGSRKSGRLYYYRISSANSSGSNSSEVFPVVTTSSTSTGQIQVYFNFPTDATLSLQPVANGNTNLAAKLLERITAAKQSIDLALYSFDDFSSNPAIVAGMVADSLIGAKNRGVKVRVVFQNRPTTTALQKLISAGIPVLKRNVPETGSGMHNKFWIFDGRDTTSATDDWLISGSWNVTNSGTLVDAQNAVFIQDQSLARIYTMEFEELFGSNTETANGAIAKFGPTKLDNTPHFTFVNGKKVESYFSPSDKTTAAIVRAINSANNNVFFGLFSFTRDEIGAEIIARKNAGVIVRGIIDNIGDSGSEFSPLVSSGVDVRQAGHSVVTGDFHHKYGVVDPFHDASDPVVVTGSHNWSSSAENDNDENTLIIHSGELARQFVQEFAKRYQESGGTGPILKVERVGSMPDKIGLSQNYPNPFNPSTSIDFQLPQRTIVTLSVFDILGRRVAILLNEEKQAGAYRVTWDASGLPSGIYFCRMQTSSYSETRKMMLMK